MTHPKRPGRDLVALQKGAKDQGASFDELIKNDWKCLPIWQTSSGALADVEKIVDQAAIGISEALDRMVRELPADAAPQMALESWS
jgi:hypothetical protein